MGREKPVADEAAFELVLISALSPLLGRHTARHAIKLARQKLGADRCLEPEQAKDVARFLEPMLRTLVGRATAASVCANIARSKEGRSE